MTKKARQVSIEQKLLDMVGAVLDDVSEISTKRRGRHPLLVLVKSKLEAMGYRVTIPRGKPGSANFAGRLTERHDDRGNDWKDDPID
jgi:hypothetical protein